MVRVADRRPSIAQLPMPVLERRIRSEKSMGLAPASKDALHRQGHPNLFWLIGVCTINAFLDGLVKKSNYGIGFMSGRDPERDQIGLCHSDLKLQFGPEDGGEALSACKSGNDRPKAIATAIARGARQSIEPLQGFAEQPARGTRALLHTGSLEMASLPI